MNLQKSAIKSLPPKNWKVQEGLIAHTVVHEKVDKTIKRYKPVSKIGTRHRERIKQFGSETILHDKVWESRSHSCEICGKYIQERQPWCFAHRLGKGMYSKYRYMVENIGLVDSIDCHHAVDKIYQGNNPEQIEVRTKLIKELDIILLSNK